MKVCFLALNAYATLSGSSEARVGGAEVQMIGIARYLADRGHAVCMVTRDQGQEEGERLHGVEVLKAFRADAGLPYLRFFHPRWTGIWRALKRANADIYYQRCAAMETGLLAMFCRVHGKRYVFASGSDSDFDPGRVIVPSRRDKALYLYGLKRADGVVTQTRHQQALLRQRYGRDSTVISNGWPGAACLDAPADRRTDGSILWVSTLRGWKRPGLFLDLAEQLPEQRFVMVGGPASGEQELFEAIRQRASQLDNVEFQGFVPFDRVSAYFDNAALLVNTSEPKEGFPNTFLQAWQSGIPVVSFFDPDGIVEKEGLGAVPASLEEMVLAVRSMKGGAEMYAETGQKARNYFQANHRLAVIGARYESELLRIADRSC